ncbi:MAG: translation initiation factor IF-2 [Fidelibacterota bacterium]
MVDLATGKRIVHIAKEFNISHKDIIDLLKKHGIEVKSHMSLIDEDAYQLILEEFEQDRLSVERYRKEQVRKEIHTRKLEEKIQASQAFEIMMPKEQRKLEEKEKAEKEEKEKKREELEKLQDQEAKKPTPKVEEVKKEEVVESEKIIPEREKMQFRTIDVAEIQAKIETPRRRVLKKKAPETEEEKAKHASIESTIKKTLAQVETKSKRKKYKKLKEDEEELVEVEKQQVKLTEFMTVQELARVLDISPPEIISKCFELGIPATMNQRLNFDTISLITEDAGLEAVLVDESSDTLFSFEDTEEDLNKALPRAPVVTIMGHVDHGKTSLLDYIRKTNVVAGESGGITQHIGAYEVILDNGKKVTFLDTPGHEAFTAMRARGAQITDVVILIVAANDGVKPQTIEAINHAKSAEVPLVVAINKIDLPEANPDRVKSALSENGVVVEDWGGNVQCMLISAKTGEGVDELLELLALETDILELKANPDTLAKGTVIESRLDKGHGAVATLLVRKGTLKVGDPFLCGNSFGKVRALMNERNIRITQAGPSDPVQVLGFETPPQAGDRFAVVQDEKEARHLSAEKQRIQREIDSQMIRAMTLDRLSQEIREGLVSSLPLIIKADVDGSIEALVEAFRNIPSDEVGVDVVHTGVGNITESDVLLAQASGAIVIGFNVTTHSNANLLAKNSGIDIRSYSVIYDAVNEIKLALEGLLEPEIVETPLGKAEVLRVFKISSLGSIAGCKVVEGTISKNDLARLFRDGEMIQEGSISSLKHFQDEVKSIEEGKECGIGIEGVKTFKEGDFIETYSKKEVKRTLD